MKTLANRLSRRKPDRLTVRARQAATNDATYAHPRFRDAHPLRCWTRHGRCPYCSTRHVVAAKAKRTRRRASAPSRQSRQPRYTRVVDVKDTDS